MNEINDLEFAGYADSDAIFQPLPGTLTPNKENAARFVKLAEKHGGSSDEFICGEVVGKSLDIRGRRIEATICTPVIEDGGEFVGKRHTRAFIANESTKIRSRQAAGIELAKTRGAYRGRKPVAVDKEAFGEVYGRWRTGELTAVGAMEALGVKKDVFYRLVRERAG